MPKTSTVVSCSFRKELSFLIGFDTGEWGDPLGHVRGPLVKTLDENALKSICIPKSLMVPLKNISVRDPIS